MLLKHLFENVDQHVAESELATFALRSFREQFFRKDTIQKRYLILNGPEVLKRLTIHPDFKGEPRSGYVSSNGYEIHMFMAMDQDYNKAAKYVRTYNFESIFRHEFQHFLDHTEKRFSDTDRNHEVGKEYVNSAAEYPAWFKQQAEPLLRILRAAKNNESLHAFPKIEPDFATFMRDGSHWAFSDWLVPTDLFNKKTKIRYLRDLAAVHKAVVAVEGATGPLKPRLVTQLMIWLGKKLNITL